eukprot:Skav221935  [mRNA]  locus=scaffold195:309730:311964:+ [translate_table: standard]
MWQVYFTEENLATLASETLNSMVERILLPVKYGLMEHPVCNPVDGGCDHEIFEVNATSQEHHDLARRMVAESVMLLKNEDETLPLVDVKKIALLGSACDQGQNISAMLNQWDLGNYYTVGGSGRVIPNNPVPGVSVWWISLSGLGMIKRYPCIKTLKESQSNSRVLMSDPLPTACRTIAQGIRNACLSANCVVEVDGSDDPKIELGGAKAAAAMAARGHDKADVAIICGATTSAEGMDRAMAA